MKTFVRKVLAVLPAKGVDYADVRVTGQASENISTKNGSVEAVTKSSDSGFGLRVLVNGAWSFAASSRLVTNEIRKVVKDTVKIAKASNLTGVEKIELSHLKPQKGSYRTPVKVDPFKISAEQKINLLLKADFLIRRNELLRRKRAGYLLPAPSHVTIQKAIVCFCRLNEMSARTLLYSSFGFGNPAASGRGIKN
ncbi:hypothetical protein HY768_10500 [candidate division TA06 bacterium]|uniref:Metalloprotease TldD/E N-terminal domain-containing protein n=1 Tax=candidate division TA06 bacterium TaxID=2250710 RepID=A0A933IAJ7_UNCT6|nr:hypothetical protein [candidate division TA06 bacterium]